MTDTPEPAADPVATFTFAAPRDTADRILFHVREMSGVRATMQGDGPFAIVATVNSALGFEAWRLDHVENVIRGLAPDVGRQMAA